MTASSNPSPGNHKARGRDLMSQADSLTALNGKWASEYDAGDANEPDVSMINGRPSEEWEQEGIKRAILADRAKAVALVSIPPRSPR